MHALLDSLRTFDKLGMASLVVVSSWLVLVSSRLLFGLIAVFSRHHHRRRQALSVLRVLTRQDRCGQQCQRAGEGSGGSSPGPFQPKHR